MTLLAIGNSKASGHFTTPALSLLVGFAFAITVFGCGSDDAEVDGALVNVSVDPPAGYPGVELQVDLEIEPGDDSDEEEYGWAVEFGDGNSHSGDGLQGSSSHAYDAVGDYQIVVNALYDGEVADTVEIDYTVFDPIDLSVDSVRVQPVNVFVDETVTVSFDIQNETASPILTPFTVRAYLFEESTLTREDFLQGDIDLVEIGDQRLEVEDDDIVLDGGQGRNVSINAPVPEVPTGSYYGVVVIDPDQQLQTSNPERTIDVSAGTIQVENIGAGLPNISVQQLEVSPDRAFPELNRVTRAFMLTNLGGEDVFNVVHRTYLQVGSPQRDDSAVLIDTSDPVNLPVHHEEFVGPEEFILSDPIVPSPGQEEEVYLIVEAFSEDGDVEESTQLNNVLSSEEPIIVSDQPVDGPDIAVNHFSVSPLSTYLGGTLELEAAIANEGTHDVSSFFCGIYINPDPQISIDATLQLSTVNITGLSAGQQIDIERELTVPGVHDPGTYYPYIVCDPVGAINQPFRGNSQAIQLDPIQITDEADIDLFVDHVTVPEAADDEEIVTVETTLCVAGTNATGTTTGALFTTPGLHVDFDTEPAKEFEVPSINPGECIDLELEVQVQCRDFIDEIRVGVFADAEGVLPEENTTNNRATSDHSITLEGRYCECIDDEFGPNQTPQSAYPIDPTVEEPKQASICEPGSRDFYTVTLDEGDSLLVSTEHDSTRGPLQTAIFAPGGLTQLDLDNSANHQQVGVFLASSDGLPYVFSVSGQDTDIKNYYDVSAEVISQPEIVDVLPRNITLPPQTSFSIGATIDVDLRIYNLGQETTGDFDAQLVLTKERDEDNVGSPEDFILATHNIDSLSPGSHRDFTLEAPLAAQIDDGDYYIAVVLDPGEVLNEENRANNIDFSPEFSIETDCYDAFSPNDSFSQATSIEPGSYSNLVACQGSSDYYEICTPNAHSLDITVDGFDPDAGDIDITLYDQTLNAIDSSAQTGVDSEHVAVDYVDGDQCYYLRVVLVSLDSEAENTYSLDIDINEVAPELQCDPTFEPNDDFETASSLWAALHYENTIDRCPQDDVDFYYVQLSPATTVDFAATLEPANQPGTLRLQLYRPNGTPEKTVETAPGIPTAEIENYTAPTTGTYFLQVSIGGDEHRVTYNLEASGLPGVDLAVEDLNIGSGTYEEGDKIRYDFHLLNYGGDAVSSTDYHVYLGTSPTPDSGADQLLGEFGINDIEPDDLLEIEGQANVPSGAAEGTQYIHVVVDPDDELGDVNRSNNRDTVPIEIVASTASEEEDEEEEDDEEEEEEEDDEEEEEDDEDDDEGQG